ncbi:MAG: DGQHR domain-containing protein [Vicinamibacteria bacterium]|jgi:DGQHR domain-containing protein|nr:DGQHR domain-containing protein [Vicinamibacteria bacterium]
MITIPALRLQQFGTSFYQAALSVADIQRLVRFEVLSFGPVQKTKPRAQQAPSAVNWEELEMRIASSEKAYQRPLLKKKIDELVQYFLERLEHMDLAPVPGAVILAAEHRLDFTPMKGGSHAGQIELPEEEGLFRALDGQHRLVALDELARTAGQQATVAEALRTLTVPAVIFESLSPSHAVEMFVTINTKHTKLKKDVIISLSGRKLYPDERDKRLAIAHDIVRSLNERQDSPLAGDIKILGVGAGRVDQAPLASEIETLFKNLEVGGPGAARKFMDESRAFFLLYFKQIAQVFEKAWVGRKYCLRRGTALRAFIRVVPDVISVCRERKLDHTAAADLGRVLAPWADRIGDARFETDGEWRQKGIGGGARAVDILVRELRDALR